MPRQHVQPSYGQGVQRAPASIQSSSSDIIPRLDLEADAKGDLWILPPTWDLRKNGIVRYGRYRAEMQIAGDFLSRISVYRTGCSRQKAGWSEMSTKLFSIALFLFTALTLTHAAFVDYRSGASESPRNQDKTLNVNPVYLQTRKYGVKTVFSCSESRSIWRGTAR